MNENYERTIALAERLKNEGWVIHSIDVDKRELNITKYYASLKVWFSVESEYRVKINIKDTYDTEHYRYAEQREDSFIETIVKMIRDFNHDNFRLVTINKYGKTYDGHDRYEYHYFPSGSSLIKSLTGDYYNKALDEENIFSFERYEYQHPNPLMKLIVERVSGVPDELKGHYLLKESTIIFKCFDIEYKNNGKGEPTAEEKERKTYYALVDFTQNKNERREQGGNANG